MSKKWWTILFLSVLVRFCTGQAFAVTRSSMIQEFEGIYYPLTSLSTPCTDVAFNAAITAMQALSPPRNLLQLTPVDGAGVACTWTLAANVTVPRGITLRVPDGVRVSVNAGQTLTINGPLMADDPDWYTGAGTVTLTYRDWSVDGFSSYVVSGCLPTAPGASLTLGAFACSAQIRSNGQWYPIAQTAAAVGPLSAVDGTYWLAVHRDTTTALAGWTRQAGTHYLWQYAATQPTDPAGGMVFAQVVVAGGVITEVGTLGNRQGVRPAADIFNVVAYGADPTGSRDSGRALTSACAALQAAGGGTLLFPHGTYALYTVGTTYTNPCVLTDLVGVQLLSQGSTLAIDAARTFTTSYGVLFSMVRLTNLTIDGFNVTGPTLPVADTAVVGVELFTCQQCTNIVMPHNRVHGVIAALKLQSSGGPAAPGTKTQRVHVGLLDVRDSFYGILTQFCCDDVTVERLVTNHVHRSFFAFGDSHRNSVHVFSTNPTATDVIFAALQEHAPRDIELWYTNELTNNATMNQAFVTVGWSDENPAIISNIKVDLQVAYQVPTGGNFNGSAALRINKFNASVSPDSADHGHILRNLTVSGRISGLSTTPEDGPINTNEANGQRQGTGDFWSNILFQNLYVEPASAQGFRFSIGSVIDQITLLNVTAPYVDLRGATNSRASAGKIRVINSAIPNQYQAILGDAVTRPGLDVITPPSAAETVAVGWTGKTLTNFTQSNMTWTLPPANVGLRYTFLRDGTNTLRVEPDGTDTIRGCGAGKYRDLDAQGNYLELYSATTSVWEVIGSIGTNTCEP